MSNTTLSFESRKRSHGSRKDVAETVFSTINSSRGKQTRRVATMQCGHPLGLTLSYQIDGYVRIIRLQEHNVRLSKVLQHHFATTPSSHPPKCSNSCLINTQTPCMEIDEHHSSRADLGSRRSRSSRNLSLLNPLSLLSRFRVEWLVVIVANLFYNSETLGPALTEQDSVSNR